MTGSDDLGWPMPAPTQAELDDLARRSRRRILTLGVIGGVGGALVGPLSRVVVPQVIPRAHHQSMPNRHASLAVAALVLVLVVVLALAVVVIRLVRRGHGIMAPWLINGLPRRERRIAFRAIRRGVPSNAPLLRVVEHQTAERMVRYRKVSLTIISVLLVGIALFATAAQTWGLRVVALVAALMLASGLVNHAWLIVGARRYLES